MCRSNCTGRCRGISHRFDRGSTGRLTWTEAIQVRMAYQDGVDDANDEAEAAADLLG